MDEPKEDNEENGGSIMQSIMPPFQRQFFIDTYSEKNVKFSFGSNTLRQAYIEGWRACLTCIVLVYTNDRTCLVCKKQYRTTLKSGNRRKKKRG